MSRLSPQEQAPHKSKPADCRGCVHHRGETANIKAWCGRHHVALPGLPCADYSPAPPRAPASPPVSADREGTDVLTAARELTRWDWTGLLVDHPDADEVKADVAGLARAISSEEARRARTAGPAMLMVDERKAAALLGDLDHYTGPVFAVDDPRDATIRDLRAKLRQWATELDRPAKALEEASSSERGLGWIHAAGRDAMEATNLRALAAALRSAGVEPTPTPGAAQEGKASR